MGSRKNEIQLMSLKRIPILLSFSALFSSRLTVKYLCRSKCVRYDEFKGSFPPHPRDWKITLSCITREKIRNAWKALRLDGLITASAAIRYSNIYLSFGRLENVGNRRRFPKKQWAISFSLPASLTQASARRSQRVSWSPLFITRRTCRFGMGSGC